LRRGLRVRDCQLALRALRKQGMMDAVMLCAWSGGACQGALSSPEGTRLPAGAACTQEKQGMMERFGRM